MIVVTPPETRERFARQRHHVELHLELGHLPSFALVPSTEDAEQRALTALFHDLEALESYRAYRRLQESDADLTPDDVETIVEQLTALAAELERQVRDRAGEPLFVNFARDVAELCEDIVSTTVSARAMQALCLRVPPGQERLVPRLAWERGALGDRGARLDELLAEHAGCAREIGKRPKVFFARRAEIGRRLAAIRAELDLFSHPHDAVDEVEEHCLRYVGWVRTSDDGDGLPTFAEVSDDLPGQLRDMVAQWNRVAPRLRPGRRVDRELVESFGAYITRFRTYAHQVLGMSAACQAFRVALDELCPPPSTARQCVACAGSADKSGGDPGKCPVCGWMRKMGQDVVDGFSCGHVLHEWCHVARLAAAD